MSNHFTYATASGRRRGLAAAVTTAGVVLTLVLSGCTALDAGDSSTSSIAGEVDFYDTSTVHSIGVEFDQGDYDAMIASYEESRTKDWISATVTIDGTTYDDVGLRLKGNSSLATLIGGGMGPGMGPDADGTAADEPTDPAEATESAAATESAEAGPPASAGASGEAAPQAREEGDTDQPETLPWLIRLDEFSEGQQHQGRTEFVVRGNNSETSLNEAVALDLLGESGLVTQQATATRFSANGSKEQLRLVIESPDDELWSEDNFTDAGNTYEAETEGDYSYRGADTESYKDAFDQKTGDEEDLQPVVDFLDFVNNSTDEDFSTQLDEHLDVDAFASYLAFHELIGNMDDINGPGNNSYLRYDESTGQMTVVSWDLNLAFGMMLRGGTGDGGMQPPEGMELPEGMQPPEDMELPEGMQPPEDMELPEGMPERGAGDGDRPVGGMSRENPLATRFLADPTFKALYDEKLAQFEAELYDSGRAQDILDGWTDLLTSQASDLVEARTVRDEAADIASYFSDEHQGSGPT